MTVARHLNFLVDPKPAVAGVLGIRHVLCAPRRLGLLRADLAGIRKGGVLGLQFLAALFRRLVHAFVHLDIEVPRAPPKPDLAL